MTQRAVIRNWTCRAAVPAITILLWAWRVGAWVTRSAFSTDGARIPIVGAAVLGLAADLVVAVVANRLLERIRLSLGTAIPLALALSVPVFSIRALDVICCYLDMQHWQPHGFAYLSLNNAHLLLQSPGPWLVALWALSVAAASLVWSCVGARVPEAVQNSSFGASDPNAFPRWRGDLVPFVLVALVIGAAVVWPIAGSSMQLMPEINFARAGWHWLFPGGGRQSSVELRPEARRNLAEFGLLPSVSSDPDYPMFADDVHERPLGPEGISADTTADKVAPDVVITLMESVNPEMIAGLGGPVAGITPNLDRLSKEMTQVNGFHGTASPTLGGLVAHLCSTFAALDGRMMNSKGLPSQTRLFCLPHLLRRRGYRTLFIQGGSKDFANKEAFLRAAGFEQILAKKDLRRAYPDAHVSRWGYHDEQLVDFAIGRIDEAAAKRKRDGRPYLLVMLMLDTHFPGLPPPHCQPDLPQVEHFSADIQNYFRSVYCTDKALGKLSDHLLADGRKDSLLWAITSDHRTGPTRGMRQVYSSWGERFRPRFGPLPLLIHDPYDRIPSQVDTLSGSQDLAPTIAHLLGIPLGPNSFEGRSIFGSRASVPFIVGVASDNRMWVENPTGGKDVSARRLHELCLEKKPVLDRGSQPTSCDLEDWFNLQRDLWRQNRFVPTVNAGVWGVYADCDCRAPWRAPRNPMERVGAEGRAWVEIADKENGCNALGCPGQPGWVYVATRKEVVSGKTIPCLRMHPPRPGGSIGVAMPASDELELAQIRVSLPDGSVRAGGGPVSVEVRGNGGTMTTLELSDQKPTAEYRLGEDTPVSGFSIIAHAEHPKNRALCVELE